MIPPSFQRALDKAVAALKSKLGENLHSCILYGSAVRDTLIEGESDLNLLIVLEESTPAAHEAIANAIKGPVRIEPFVLARGVLARSIQAFAIKFLSIKRDHRVLCGEDVLSDIHVDEDLGKFLCEQAVRNLRLRCVHAFIVSGSDAKQYERFLASILSSLFVDLSEALRRGGGQVPDAFQDRIPVLEKTFGGDATVLRELSDLKSRHRRLTTVEVRTLHARVFGLLDRAVRWMETQWPPLS